MMPRSHEKYSPADGRGREWAGREALAVVTRRGREVTAEIPLTGALVVEATGARLAGGDPERVFAGVSIDSRTLAPGALFVAIAGERFDGADFAGDALRAGAAGLLVPRGRAAEFAAAGVVLIEADDTTCALQDLARAVRRASGTTVVAITGSAGKTTTKDVAASLLEIRYRVVRNAGNLNNHIGLPLSLIELRRQPDMAVVELGMNHAGEIRTLVGIAEPDVRVWTNVGEAHLGFFASVDAIADAKAEILEQATAATLLVANADDDRIMARVGRFDGRLVTFGIDRPADVRAVEIEDRGIDGTGGRVETPAGSVRLTMPLVGRGSMANVLAAMAVGLELGIPLDAIPERVARLKASAHRGEVLRLGRGITVIDDSYNANPTATRRALEVLARSEGRRRVAVLGEMLELGEQSVALHRQVGESAGAVDVLISVGGEAARVLGEGAARAGVVQRDVHHVPTSDEAAALLMELVSDGDVVLVKGSRGIRTDRVVERLVSELG
jgi:UDP-N-acetylmuramoyl-tripeptide--D-alanyl-D-alanine ligase